MLSKNNSLIVLSVLLLALTGLSVVHSATVTDSGRANQLFSDARQFEERGEAEQAYEFYRKASELDPTHFRAVYRAGRLLHQMGHLADAIAAMQRTLAIAPDFYPAHNTLGILLGDTGFIQAAVEAYRRGVEAAPDMPSAWRNYARSLAETGELQQAVTAYQRAVELDPTHESSLIALGILQGRLGQREQAVQTLQRVIEQNSDNQYAAEAISWVAGSDDPVIFFREGEPSALSSDDDPVIALTGGSFTESGVYRPPNMALDSPVKLRDRGVRLIHQGEYRLGMRVLEQARRYGEQDPVLFSELGYAHFQLGLYEPAAWAYGMAAEQSDETTGWHRLNQAVALREAGDLPGAEKAVKRAIKLDPGLAHANYLHGLILLEQSEMTGATRAFRKASKLDPKNVSVHLALAATLVTRSQEEEAIRVYRNALRVHPGDPEALYQLAPLLEQEGEIREALNAWEALALSTANDPDYAAWNALANQKVKELTYVISQEEATVADSGGWSRLKFWTQ